MITFLIATKNFGKLAEFKALLRDFDCEIISTADIDIPEIDENGTTFEENALIKARAASCVAQDRGYYVIGDDCGGYSVAACKGPLANSGYGQAKVAFWDYKKGIGAFPHTNHGIALAVGVELKAKSFASLVYGARVTPYAVGKGMAEGGDGFLL